MKKATNYFIGKHDFDAFRSIDCQSSTSLKTIDKCELQNEDEKIFINISAKSFLHFQVRYLQMHLKLEIRLLYFRSFFAFHFRRIT